MEGVEPEDAGIEVAMAAASVDIDRQELGTVLDRVGQRVTRLKDAFERYVDENTRLLGPDGAVQAMWALGSNASERDTGPGPGVYSCGIEHTTRAAHSPRMVCKVAIHVTPAPGSSFWLSLRHLSWLSSFLTCLIFR